MAQQLLQTLSKAVVYVPGTDNVSTNRKLWDSYAREWNDQPAWLEKMANAVGETPSVLGAEWSTTADLEFVWNKYVAPFLRPDGRVLEIGPGGGRLTTRLINHLGPHGRLVCADISEGMLAACRQAVEGRGGGAPPLCSVTYVHIPEGEEAGMDLSVLTSHAPFDFILCFDVWVHVSVKPQWAYLSRFAHPDHAWLAQGGKAFLSTANILAPRGWERFVAQKKESAGGFCWSSPDLVDALVHRAGLAHVLRSWPMGQEGGNMYEERDYLLVVERAAHA